ncbi:T9SS type A sorting domain-containing protein [Hymenobacter defluvii]|uniref:T9SS type A sorting domain-containing protein n=1 Tax=Hymenobacter defluvii TaxID=2054411 RepID=A0ABS3T7B3_9BACT|nr:T9SS type A sorting domain-containing protein [Hymenobacter defluvii]MBO3269538.1 T9SS type A sorting domain-containing protein [Hymenobacter defluvii]
MNKLFTLSILLGSVCVTPALAQTTSINYVTEIVTSYGGYWQSGVGSINPIKPDNSHNLLSFTANGVRYSTGVNDQLLLDKGLVITPTRFQALPVITIGTPNSNTKVGLGQLYDGVDNGPSNPPPSKELASYLTDGPNGLDIGTGIANLPAGNIAFVVRDVQAAALNDGVPDILVTQIASPNASLSDTYGFYDAADVLIGNTVDVTYNTDFPAVGNWVADFYEASQTPRTLTLGFTKTERPIRLWSADLSKFGITKDNYSAIARFKIRLSGDSDVAFVAYNSRSVTVLPVQLTSFSGSVETSGAVRLQWHTASEVNSAAFVVETSMDGQTFVPVGRVAAAGNKTTDTNYSYLHRPTATGVVYYRLHQLDRDGTGAYSPVTAVALPSAEDRQVQVAPNPFRETLRLQLPALATTGHACLLAADGRQVYQHVFTPDELAEAACVLRNVPALQPGLYLLQVLVNGQITQQKLIKQ